MIPDVISFLKEDSGRKLSNRRSVAVYKLSLLANRFVATCGNQKTGQNAFETCDFETDAKKKKIMQVTKKALL